MPKVSAQKCKFLKNGNAANGLLFIESISRTVFTLKHGITILLKGSTNTNL